MATPRPLLCPLSHVLPASVCWWVRGRVGRCVGAHRIELGTQEVADWVPNSTCCTREPPPAAAANSVSVARLGMVERERGREREQRKLASSGTVVVGKLSRSQRMPGRQCTRRNRDRRERGVVCRAFPYELTHAMLRVVLPDAACLDVAVCLEVLGVGSLSTPWRDLSFSIHFSSSVCTHI